MEENKEITPKTEENSVKYKTKTILKDVLAGFGMGVAFIIPGFSGGSVAAILGIYEKLIGAIADIFKSFFKSVKTLLPIFIGLVLGAVSLLYPLGWALEAYPIPTVSLFVGLAIGGMPSITDKIKGRPTVSNIAAFLIPCLLAALLSFIEATEDKNLLALDFGGYLTLFIIGIVGASALVIPGISGSMILLILGYYNPIIQMLTDHLLAGKDILVSLLVLGSCGLGIVIGFFGISVIMKHLLAKYPRGTYFAIVGFIIGSVPTVYVSTARDVGLTISTLPSSPLYWIVTAALALVGFTLAFLFCRLAKKINK